MMGNRLYWKDSDWADYFKCPIAKIQEYRSILNKIFVSRVDINEKDGKYHFCLYNYRVNESGNKMLRLLVSATSGFYSEQVAIDYSNEQIIPRLVLQESFAKRLGIPDKAIQMLTIKDKER